MSVVRPYRIKVPSNGAINMSKSLHLIISYLPRDEHEDLDFKSYG